MFYDWSGFTECICATILRDDTVQSESSREYIRFRAKVPLLNLQLFQSEILLKLSSLLLNVWYHTYDRLEDSGYSIGQRVTELIGMREHVVKRETRIVNMLQVQLFLFEKRLHWIADFSHMMLILWQNNLVIFKYTIWQFSLFPTWYGDIYSTRRPIIWRDLWKMKTNVRSCPALFLWFFWCSL